MKHDREITDVRLAKALAHPLRVRILGILDERIASPRQLATELNADLSLVSYHVRTLHRLGIVELVSRKRRRAVVESFYRALERPVVSTSAWTDLPPVHKKALARATIDQMGRHVSAAIVSGGFERGDAHLTRSPMVLDAQAFAEVAGELDRLLGEFERIAAEAEQRLARSDHAGAIDATAILLLFETAPTLLSGNGTHSGDVRHRRFEAAEPA